MAPGVEEFIWHDVLRLDEAELLSGAKLAALSLNRAVSESLRGSEQSFEGLERSNAVSSTLHATLQQELMQIQAGGDATISHALEKLQAERAHLEEATSYMA